MWIMTTRGFYSAVQHRDDLSLLMVRARSEADLVALNELAVSLDIEPTQIVATLTGADYPYRTVIPTERWIQLLTALTLDIDYENFKDAVGKREGGAHVRAHTYTKVWSALHDIEREPTAGVYPPALRPSAKVPKAKRKAGVK